MDVLTKKQRSFNMSKIKSRNTALEIMFRKYLWKKGIRGYRIKNKIIGKPDLYFPLKRIAVFIDGCFWHKCPVDYKNPKSNTQFWNKKISENIVRDKKVIKILKKQNIKVLRFWEHEVEENIEISLIRLNKLTKN